MKTIFSKGLALFGLLFLTSGMALAVATEGHKLVALTSEGHALAAKHHHMMAKEHEKKAHEHAKKAAEHEAAS